ncbi:MAG: GNAT family N-acetyltransferase [Acholeplasmataceae bacterium]|nr:GNAT family N-acetyltransferase [Acholeplasmataceae bacterium]
MTIRNNTIRMATLDDLDEIIRLINGIAVYEKMTQDVSLDRQRLSKTLFEDHEAEVILALIEDKVVGFAFFFNHVSTFLGETVMYLEDLYVDPDFRGQGIGKRLFSEVAKMSAERGQKRMDWICLDWNTQALEFYESLGATILSQWRLVRLEGENLAQVAKDALKD